MTQFYERPFEAGPPPATTTTMPPTEELPPQFQPVAPQTVNTAEHSEAPAVALPTYRPPLGAQPSISEELAGKLASRTTAVLAMALVGVPFLFTILGPILNLTAIFMGAKTWQTYKEYGRKAPTRLVAGLAIAGLSSLFATVLVFNTFTFSLMN